MKQQKTSSSTFDIFNSDPVAVDLGGLYLLPKGGVFFNTYERVMSSKSLLRSYGNTLYVVFLGTAVSLLLTVMTSFALSKKKIKGNKFFIVAILFTMLFNGGIIPTYLTVRATGLLNSLWALIIPGAIIVPNLIILISFFREIPDSLEESAVIDGCSVPMIRFKIKLPLSTPAIATISLFYIVYYWNDFFQCMLYISDAKKYVMQLVLRNLILQGDTSFLSASSSIGGDYSLLIKPQSLKMATIIFTTLPVLVAYPFIQKYFIKGITLGALKG